MLWVIRKCFAGVGGVYGMYYTSRVSLMYDGNFFFIMIGVGGSSLAINLVSICPLRADAMHSFLSECNTVWSRDAK